MTRMEILISMIDKQKMQDNFHLGIHDDPLSVEYEFCRKLYEHVVDKKPSVVVEVGTGHGASTAWISLGLEENGVGEIFTIDHEERPFHLWTSIGTGDRVRKYIGDSERLIKDMPDDIDMVFHDSQHRIENITHDLEMLIPKVSLHGYIFIHDTQGTVGRLLKEFFKKKSWDFINDDRSCGLGMATREKIKNEG